MMKTMLQGRPGRDGPPGRLYATLRLAARRASGRPHRQKKSAGPPKKPGALGVMPHPARCWLIDRLLAQHLLNTYSARKLSCETAVQPASQLMSYLNHYFRPNSYTNASMFWSPVLLVPLNTEIDEAGT